MSTDNPLEPGPQDYDRVNVMSESDLTHWTRELGVPRERLAAVIQEVGPRLPDILKRLAMPSA